MSAALATTMAAVGTGVAYAGIKTAEAQLAKTLASSLSQYLEVDPQDIESQLLLKGCIELSDVRLKPQFVPIAANTDTGVLMLDGVMDTISFSWTWGMNILNDSTLTVSGVRLRLIIDPDGKAPTTEVSTETAKSTTEDPADDVSTESETESDASQDRDDGLNPTVQHILDQLSVNITDVKLGVQIKDSDTDPLVVEVESLGVLAGGRDDAKTSDGTANTSDDEKLHQVVLKMLKVYVSHNNEEVPILDPVEYMANVIRNASSGGIEIAGKLPEKERGIVVRMGTIQMQTLLVIQEALTVASNGNDQEPAVDSTSTKDTEDSAFLSVVLPIPLIRLVLPNDASIATKMWRFIYMPKESVSQLEGKGASIVVGQDDFKLLQLDAAATFLVNLTGKMISLESSDGTNPKLAQLDWKEKQTKSVLEGFAQLSELCSNPDQKEVELQEIHSVGKKVADGAKELTPTKPWSLNVDGMIAARLEGTGTRDGEPQWLEASITSPYFEMSQCSDELMHKVGLQRARIGPTSFGDMMVDMGPTSVETNAMKKSAVDTLSQFLQRIFGIHHSS